MNFELSEEQKMIQQSVERFVQDNYDLNTRISISAKDSGYSSEFWKSMAELGWLGLPFGLLGQLFSRGFSLHSRVETQGERAQRKKERQGQPVSVLNEASLAVS